jgi:hypothetical protein
LTEVFSFFGRPPYADWGKRPLLDTTRTDLEKWSDRGGVFRPTCELCLGMIPSSDPNGVFCPDKAPLVRVVSQRIRSTKVNASLYIRGQRVKTESVFAVELDLR